MNTVLRASDPAAAAAFAAEVVDRLGRCDAVAIAPGPVPTVDFDELSADEWIAFSEQGMTAPLVTAQAFSRVIERGGGGSVVFVVDAAAHGDVANSVLAEGLRAMAANLGITWHGRGLRALMVSREGAPERIVAALQRA
jgi:NAD(P)-dependent dehydrogenase (short-subunit alcohol dehydrogenase family)